MKGDIHGLNLSSDKHARWSVRVARYNTLSFGKIARKGTAT